MSEFSVEDVALIQKVRDKMRISKVVCTRALKTRNGDFFVGFSSAWDTTQEDAGGPGTGLVSSLEEGEVQIAESQGMTLKEARIAGYLLAMTVDLQAQEHALAGGGLTQEEYEVAQRVSKRRHTAQMLKALSRQEKGVS
jgi:hypothetical protein